jgi:uncharacterized protein with HEPN domain
MSLRDDDVTLRQMRAHAAEAVALAQGRSSDALSSDRLLELALTRLVEVVGEAATRVSASRVAAMPDVAWKPLIGMRNRLIHGYDAVDVAILWAVVAGDLPELVRALDRYQFARDAAGGH